MYAPAGPALRVGSEYTAVAGPDGLALSRYVEGRDGAVELRPRSSTSWRPRYVHLVGRDPELAVAERTIQARQVVEFAGEPGVGKTALLRSVAKHVGDSGPPVVKPAAGPLDDVLTALVHHFWESDGRPYVITPDLCDELLADVQAVVLLDQPPFNEDEVHALLDAASQCAVVITSRRRVLRGRGLRSQTLSGLDADAALALFEEEMGGSLSPEECDDARTLCELLGGFPWHIQRAAGLVKDGVTTTNELFAAARAAGAEGPARQWLSEKLLHRLNEEQLRVVGMLERFGCPVHLRHFAVLAQLDDPAAVVESLEERGIIEAHSPVYSLCEGRLPARSRVADSYPLDEALEYLGGWAHEHREHTDLVVSDAPLLGAALGLAVKQRRRPREALRIARALDAALFPAGRWAAWELALRAGRDVARQSRNASAEAWFLHQVGTRALCLGDRRQAIRDLRRAYAMRERDGDESGAATTLQNLTVAGARPGRRLRVSRRRRPMGIGAAVAVPAGHGGRGRVATAGVAVASMLASAAVLSVLVLGGSLVPRSARAIPLSAAVASRDNDEAIVTLRNRSEEPLNVDAVTVARRLGARVVTAESCTRLQPGATCDVRVSTRRADHLRALEVAADGQPPRAVRIEGAPER